MLLHRNLIFIRHEFGADTRVFYTLGRPEPTDPILVRAAARNRRVVSRVVFPEETNLNSNYSGWTRNEGTSILTKRLDEFYRIATPIAFKVSQGMQIQAAIIEEINRQTFQYAKNGFPIPNEIFLSICRKLIILFGINLDDPLNRYFVRDFMLETFSSDFMSFQIPPFPTETTG